MSVWRTNNGKLASTIAATKERSADIASSKSSAPSSTPNGVVNTAGSANAQGNVNSGSTAKGVNNSSVSPHNTTGNKLKFSYSAVAAKVATPSSKPSVTTPPASSGSINIAKLEAVPTFASSSSTKALDETNFDMDGNFNFDDMAELFNASTSATQDSNTSRHSVLMDNIRGETVLILNVGGEIYEGILDRYTLADQSMSVILVQRQSADRLAEFANFASTTKYDFFSTSLSTAPFEEQKTFSLAQVQAVILPRFAKQIVGDVGKFTTDDEHLKRMNTERTLEKWAIDDEPIDMVKEKSYDDKFRSKIGSGSSSSSPRTGLGVGSHHGSSSASSDSQAVSLDDLISTQYSSNWNQFKANQKFLDQSARSYKFDFNKYTAAIDVNSATYKDDLEAARRIAIEIDNQFSSDKLVNRERRDKETTVDEDESLFTDVHVASGSNLLRSPTGKPKAEKEKEKEKEREKLPVLDAWDELPVAVESPIKDAPLVAPEVAVDVDTTNVNATVQVPCQVSSQTPQVPQEESTSPLNKDKDTKRKSGNNNGFVFTSPRKVKAQRSPNNNGEAVANETTTTAVSRVASTSSQPQTANGNGKLSRSGSGSSTGASVKSVASVPEQTTKASKLEKTEKVEKIEKVEKAEKQKKIEKSLEKVEPLSTNNSKPVEPENAKKSEKSSEKTEASTSNVDKSAEAKSVEAEKAAAAATKKSSLNAAATAFVPTFGTSAATSTGISSSASSSSFNAGGYKKFDKFPQQYQQTHQHPQHHQHQHPPHPHGPSGHIPMRMPHVMVLPPPFPPRQNTFYPPAPGHVHGHNPQYRPSPGAPHFEQFVSYSSTRPTMPPQHHIHQQHAPSHHHHGHPNYAPHSQGQNYGHGGSNGNPNLYNPNPAKPYYNKHGPGGAPSNTDVPANGFVPNPNYQQKKFTGGTKPGFNQSNGSVSGPTQDNVDPKN